MRVLNTVTVPGSMAPLFEQAQALVQSYFGDRRFAPERGSITIGDERYILVRAESLSVGFFGFTRSAYPALDDEDQFSVAGTILYDLAHGMGMADAEVFSRKMGVDDPIARLSCGPVHFAHAGWAFVEISAESSPSMDDEFYLVYDHPYSFEAASWLERRDRAPGKVCFMGAGYSAGWCQVSFGVPLVAREILCRAHGDPACRFVMAPPHRIDERIAAYRAAHPDLFADRHA